MATALLVALALGVVGAGGGGFFRRRGADQRTSVKDYQQALDTLRHMATRRAETEGGTPRPAPSRNGNGLPPVARSAAARAEASSRRGAPAKARGDAASAAGNGAGAAPQRPRTRTGGPAPGRSTEKIASSAGSRGRSPRRVGAAAFRSGQPAVSARVDTAEVVELPTSPVPEETPPELASTPDGASPPRGATRPGADTAVVEVAPTRVVADTVHHLAAARDLVGTRPVRTMPSKRRTVRAGRTTVLTAAAILLIVAVTVAAVALRPSHHTAAAGSTPARPPATTQVAHRAASRAAKPKTSASHGSTTGALTPVSATSSSATYRVGSSSFELALVADGACWVEATDPSTGQVLWTGTMQAGQSQQVPGSGQVVLRLGDAHNVTLTVGGRPVVLPPGFDSVVELTFQST